mmetsp:Transcript_32574/g.74367  ORF Transcript_32574/g.74367 Transcript_32574/m.74367 type:complete len:416 (+) Transcript_32574:64-1311(+)
MAYRELRNFTEMMRALGYARPISVENFKNPNFDLVADVLRWLVLRYEPNGDLGKEVGTMQDRVIFLKQASSIMLAKGRIKLNTKRLYQADGFAVKELLKIAQVLYDAMRSNPDEDEDLLVGDAFSLKLNDLKDVRDLAAEITEHGVTLSELLNKEDSLREARQKAVSRNAEMTGIEQIIKQNIRAAEANKQNKVKLIEELEQDRQSLEKKKEKKATELERNKKRYKSLVTVRPAFMDEYEKLEDELQDLFRDYLERYRNLDYIENQLETLDKKEQERIDESERALKRMQKKLKEEDMRVLRGDVQLDENDLDDSLLDDASSDEDGGGGGGAPSGAERPKTKSGTRAHVQGSLTGGMAEEDSDSSGGGDDMLSLPSGSEDGLMSDSEAASGQEFSGSESGDSGIGSGGSDGSENSF